MEDHYNRFDGKTNGVRVFDADISTGKLDPERLTEKEMKQRLAWKTLREELREQYSALPLRERVNSPEDILCERVVPPPLGEPKLNLSNGVALLGKFYVISGKSHCQH